MTAPEVFGVYTAQFPFLDANETKIRPVIVVSEPQGRYNIVTIVPVSSRIVPQEVDVVLAKWSEAGLLKPSVARVHRITTMLQADLIAELGVLSDQDAQAMQSALRGLLNL